MRISVLGCGRWGSFIAWYLHKIGHQVTSWGLPESPEYQRLAKEHKNDVISFDPDLTISCDLSYAVQNAEVIIISISSQALRSFLPKVVEAGLEDQPIVLCMKGIEETTGLRLSQIVREFATNPVAVWVGPGHVQDFAAGIPNCMVIDSKNDEIKRMLVHEFSSELIRFYFGTDLIGNEVGAASKNVIGIAAGMLDGLGLVSLKGALMSRGTREISRLIGAMGGNPISAYGLCHLGDYQATLFSPHSHNRRFGELYIQGKPYDKLAEGVSTARAMVRLGEEYRVDLPICQTVNNIVTHQKNPQEALSALFLRSLKEEF